MGCGFWGLVLLIGMFPFLDPDAFSRGNVLTVLGCKRENEEKHFLVKIPPMFRIDN